MSDKTEVGEIIKELRDFGIQLLTMHYLSEPQCKRLCELIAKACDALGKPVCKTCGQIKSLQSENADLRKAIK
jgi:hypothetical protein